MEIRDRASGVERRWQTWMLAAAASGFLSVTLIGTVSADDTPTSVPAQPDVQLAPAVVVAAGADTLDTNAVTMLTAYHAARSELGTGFQVDDGRVATVAHALIDARGVGLGAEEPQQLVRLMGDGAVASSIDPMHDLASFEADIALDGLAIADVDASVGDAVSVGGFATGGRLEVVSGRIIARTSGTGYGSYHPDVFVIDAPVSEGWSGGPVVNASGEVVAVVVASDLTSGATLAAPIAYLPVP